MSIGRNVAQTREERVEFLMTLPRLSVRELPSTGDFCPICLTLFVVILENVSSDRPEAEERSGVTKLPCGHIFCMADISEWIHTPHGSCPTCRDLFLVIPDVSDDESSDGGEYIPGSDSIADDMMDGEAWTDEEGEMWTDGEDMSLDEGVTEGETDSSWERSSESHDVDVEEGGVPAQGQSVHSADTAIITGTGEGSSFTGPYSDDPYCEQIKAELAYWRNQVDLIQLHDWVSRKEETRSMIHQAFCALNALKPRIGAIDCDTSRRLSFTHHALTTVQELHREMKSKLEMIHDVDQCLSTRRHT
ncbi:hypothetical protein K439DRAFT_1626947 [Ramaria rubella]|nr:hypothetical protein K439DRAFT_1626947 [Ramaria rubella]